MDGNHYDDAKSSKSDADHADDVSDISGSSAEDGGETLPDEVVPEEDEEMRNGFNAQEHAFGPVPPSLSLSLHDMRGSDLISNRTRDAPLDASARREMENRLAISSFRRTGSRSSFAYQRQSVGQGFSAMYEDALSRRPVNQQRIPSGVESSAHSDTLDESQLPPPYYEHTGGWLRLRPQNPANFEYRSRFPRYSFNSSVDNNEHGINYDSHQSHNSSDDRYNHHIAGIAEEEKAEEEKAEIEAPTKDNVTDYDNTTSTYDNIAPGPSAEKEDAPSRGDNSEFSPTRGRPGGSSSYLSHHSETDKIDLDEDKSAAVQSMGYTRSSIDTQWASSDSKFERYACRVDQSQGDKSVEIPLFLFQRPHMRAFHFAWMSFFVAFFTWFAIAPLLKEIQGSLGLSREEIWMSNVFGSTGTVVCRIIVGPLCDRFGARWVMALTLVISGIPVMATGLVNNAVGLYILRLVTGVAGAAFVVCQYWTTTMFTREIAGTANSLAAGWGNLGGGVTQLVMGSALFPLFKVIYGETGTKEKGEAADRAWRIVCIVPAFFSFIMAFLIVKYSDDSPKGNYIKMKKLGLKPKVEARKALREAASDFNTWLLFVHYGCCFGVEVTMTAGAAFYFSENFKQTTESAAALASIFGWMNLFARGLGGFVSDIMNVKWGMKGRLTWQFVTLVLEGVFLIAFAYAQTLGGAIATMVLFSLFVQSAEVCFCFFFNMWLSKL